MDPTTRRVLLSSSKKGDPVYVDDVFSTFLYEGTGSARSINNGIDLAGEGGLTWIKKRTGSDNNELFDTERGAGRRIRTDNSSQQTVFGSSYLNAFNSNGFTLGNDGGLNASGHKYASWSFRKAPGFFDVVTYAGNQTAGRQVAHNLGSVPGMVIVKRTDGSDDWFVYHRGLANNQFVRINITDGAAANDSLWSSTTPTSTHFTVGVNPGTNWNGRSYVAYVFAHDEPVFGTDEDESIIKCGIYTGNGSNDGPEINLGFEPQWVMTKAVSQSRNWIIGDVMRGAPVSSGAQDAAKLSANTTDAEILGDEPFVPTPTGFKVRSNSGTINDNNLTYIYMAIRRPHKPPEAGTDVFAVGRQGEVNGGSFPAYVSNFVVDMHFTKDVTSSNDNFNGARLLGENYLKTDANTSQTSRSWYDYDYMDGWGDTSNVNTNFYSWMFKRAPGFFDVVAWSGNAVSNRAITHNLGVIPELLITKRRTGGDGWWTQYTGIFGTNTGVRLDASGGLFTGVSAFNSTSAATSSAFYIGSDSAINGSADTYIAYLFATLPGISKVGSYTGTGSTINVDCGFTNGARFVLIKRTDSSGHWFLFDTTRGITSGNDPRLKLNDTAAQQIDEDHIDPLNAGFSIPVSGDVNYSGGTYIFLAIA